MSRPIHLRRALRRATLVPTLAVLAIGVAAAMPAADRPPAVEQPAQRESVKAAADRTAEAIRPRRHPAAVAAEQAFFASLVHGAMPPQEALAPLLGAFASDPQDARTCLLLGAHYLRLASMSGDHDASAIADLMLAERFLLRAHELDPADARSQAFLAPVQLALASIERAGEARRAEVLAELDRAYREDPAFSSFVVAMIGYQSPRQSALFARGLEALRAVQSNGCEEGDATCANGPRWPHNVEGYLAFFADYELKAGNPERARLLLDEVARGDSFATWPYRDFVTRRLADFDADAQRFSDDDPANDPPTAVLVRGCAACHREG